MTQAYLGVLWLYYVLYTTAETSEFYQCYERFGVSTKTQKPQLLAPCRPLETTARDAALAAIAHLATTSPPSRWQKADAEPKQALQATIPYYAARIQAIDANSVSQCEEAYATSAI